MQWQANQIGVNQGYAYAVSSDGTRVLLDNVQRSGSLFSYVPLGWTNLYTVGDVVTSPTGLIGTNPVTMSPDGSTVVLVEGTWTAAGGYVNTINLNGSRQYGCTVVGGVTITVGSSPHAGGQTSDPAYWTNGTLTVLPSYPGMNFGAAKAISADGNTIVGYVITAIDAPYAHIGVKWQRSSTGSAFGAPVNLGNLGKIGTGSVDPSAVSANGSVIVGAFQSLFIGADGLGRGISVAFRYTTATGMVSLGFIPSSTVTYPGSNATCVSGDGLVIGGIDYAIGAVVWAADNTPSYLPGVANGRYPVFWTPTWTASTPAVYDYWIGSVTGLSYDGRIAVGTAGTAAPITLSRPKTPTQVRYTAAQYLDALLDLLPTGRIWDKDPGSPLYNAISALVPTWAAVSGRGTDLLVDTFVPTTQELLPEWEASLGLPDPCLGSITDVATRRNQAVARFVGNTGLSLSYYLAYTKQLGYNCVITEYSPFNADCSSTGDAVADEAAAFAWKVSSPGSGAWLFVADVDTADSALGGWGSTVLECEMQRLAPAHTQAFVSLW